MKIRNMIIGTVVAILTMAAFAISSVAEADSFKPGDTGSSGLVCIDLDDARELVSMFDAGKLDDLNFKIASDQDFKCFTNPAGFGFIVIRKVETFGSKEIYEVENPNHAGERGFMFAPISQFGEAI